MEIILSGAIAACAAMLGSLGGAMWLSGRYAVRLARMTYAEQRRNQARHLGADIVINAARLNVTLGIAVAAVAIAQKVDKVDSAFVQELATQVEPLQGSTFDLAHQAPTFRLTFNDPELRDITQSVGAQADEVGLAFAMLAITLAASKDGASSELGGDFLTKAAGLGKAIGELDSPWQPDCPSYFPPCHASIGGGPGPPSGATAKPRLMFVRNSRVYYSASDLKAAVECEWALMRKLDAKLGRIDAVEEADDPMLAGESSRWGARSPRARELQDHLRRRGRRDRDRRRAG